MMPPWQLSQGGTSTVEEAEEAIEGRRRRSGRGGRSGGLERCVDGCAGQGQGCSMAGEFISLISLISRGEHACRQEGARVCGA